MLVNCDSSKRYATGFSLIEMMLVIAVVAILAAVAGPPMRDMLLKDGIKSAVVELRASLAQARGEAIAQAYDVTICRSSDYENCDTGGGDWSSGWITFLDKDGDAVRDAGEALIDVHEALALSAELTFSEVVSGSGARDFFQYNRQGLPGDVVNNPEQGLFVLCPQDGDSSKARGIYINATGRASETRDTDSDGNHNWSGSNELSCI